MNNNQVIRDCSTPGCHGVITTLYSEKGQWIDVCPVCKKETPAAIHPQRTEKADEIAAHAYLQIKNAKDADYAKAEKQFLSAYEQSHDDGLKNSYLFWALKACFGVEYVEDIEYENDPARQRIIYIPVIARFPFHAEALSPYCKARSLFSSRCVLSQRMIVLAQQMETLYASIKRKIDEDQASGRKIQTFIAWHDREGSTRCHDFADTLFTETTAIGIQCFVSFRTLRHQTINQFEEGIYTALASSKVFLIVVDDYDALKKKYLWWEIQRMIARQKRDPNIYIEVISLSGCIGALPSDLAALQKNHISIEPSTTNAENIRYKVEKECAAVSAIPVTNSSSDPESPPEPEKPPRQPWKLTPRFTRILSLLWAFLLLITIISGSLWFASTSHWFMRRYNPCKAVDFQENALLSEADYPQIVDMMVDYFSGKLDFFQYEAQLNGHAYEVFSAEDQQYVAQWRSLILSARIGCIVCGCASLLLLFFLLWKAHGHAMADTLRRTGQVLLWTSISVFMIISVLFILSVKGVIPSMDHRVLDVINRFLRFDVPIADLSQSAFARIFTWPYWHAVSMDAFAFGSLGYAAIWGSGMAAASHKDISA